MSANLQETLAEIAAWAQRCLDDENYDRQHIVEQLIVQVHMAVAIANAETEVER